jgi:hypothetical protein
LDQKFGNVGHGVQQKLQQPALDGLQCSGNQKRTKRPATFHCSNNQQNLALIAGVWPLITGDLFFT